MTDFLNNEHLTGLIQAAYIIAGVLFIFALAGLSKHETAKRGNIFGMTGMALALIATARAQLDEEKKRYAKDVRIGGGASVARTYLRLGLVDRLHVAIAPIVLGQGARLWDDLRGFESDYEVTSEIAESGTVHVLFRRGFTRQTLLPGTEIVVDGYQSKDGSRRANGRDLTFADGKKLFMGSSGTGAPFDPEANK